MIVLALALMVAPKHHHETPKQIAHEKHVAHMKHLEHLRELAKRHHKVTHRAPTGGSGWSNPDPGVVPGVPYSFASCVAFRESRDGQGSWNVYQITPGSGYSVSGLDLAGQKHVFSEMYKALGTSPWQPYDGCS
jgi:hypothetical protein